MRVMVHRIESIKDPSGNLGKRVELVEEEMVPSYAIRPPTEEARLVQDVFKAMQQQMPILGQQARFNSPKIILFLTEQEYEALSVRFDVNQVYDIELTEGTVKFQKVS